MLPQFLYAYTPEDVYIDLYAASEADLPNGVSLVCETNLPDDDHVKITVAKADKPFRLHLRMPRWAVEDGKSYYVVHENVQAGDVFEFDLPMHFRVTRYTGGERRADAERYALEYGPLLYAAMGSPWPVEVKWNPEKPEEWFEKAGGKLRLRGDQAHEYWAYADIHDEPFSVYPVVKE